VNVVIDKAEFQEKSCVWAARSTNVALSLARSLLQALQLQQQQVLRVCRTWQNTRRACISSLFSRLEMNVMLNLY